MESISKSPALAMGDKNIYNKGQGLEKKKSFGCLTLEPAVASA